MVSLFDLSVPNSRAKASKLLKQPSFRRGTCGASQLGGSPLALKQNFMLIFWGGAKIFHFIFFSGFIHVHCSLEYP